jgi:nitrogen fixation/metabolism regulation signal transduction histidine kinase
MMNDVRFQRMDDEYQALRNVQDGIMDGLDKTLPAMVRAIEQNREAIEQNREAIEQNRVAIEQNREAIEQNRVAIAVVNSKIDALLKHWEVDYKPPMGFKTD